MATNLKHLSIEEKIRLVQDLWRSIAAEASAVPVDPEQVAEAEERLAQYRIDGDKGIPVHQVIESIRDEL